MFTQIKKWLLPPTLATEEENRAAQLLYAIFWVVIVFMMTRVVSLINFPLPILLITSAFLSIIVVLFGGVIFLVRTERLRLASIITILLFWLNITIGVGWSGGVRGSAYIAYMVHIVITGLLLGGQWSIGISLTSIFAGYLLFSLESEGILTPRTTGLTPEAMFGAITPYFLVVGLLVAAYHRGIKVMLNQAQQKEQELAKINRELEAVRVNLETQVVERTHKAEVATQKAEEAYEVLAEQMWVITGQAQLSEKMGGDQAVSVLAQSVIEQLCLYLDIYMGALYVIDDELLTLAGKHNFVPPVDYPSQFQLGERMIGEAVQQKRPLYLNHIPQTYLMSSNHITPKPLHHIIMHPLLYDNHVLGVIELAHWTPLTSKQAIFLQRVAESIAIAIYTAQTREQINHFMATEEKNRNT